MKTLFLRLGLVASLSLASLGLVACSSDDDDTVDTGNGQVISDLDIGGDVTLSKGDTKQLTATVKYADGTNKDVTKESDLVWNIGDTGVATITQAGLVTGVDEGTTKIHATYQGKESADHALLVH